LSNGTYTVTPSKSGYTFTPSSKTVTISGANLTGVNFTASSTATYSISGTITLSGSGLSGVTVTLSGSGSGSTTTDSSGNYSFSGLSNGTYTVTPSKSGYTFTPSSRTVTVNGADVTGQDFTATAISPRYSISGKVTLKGRKTPLQGVTMTLSGAASAITATDTNGSYSFSGLTKGSYKITPSKSGYKFSPKSKTIKVKKKDVTNVNFKAKAS
jgi:inhibitor of cysteine peptidase